MGDVKIRLGGKEYGLRPTFNAMREIEAAADSSCATLMRLLARHELHVSEMALIVYHGMMEAGGGNWELESVGKRLFEGGIGSRDIREPVAKFLAELLYAPDSAKKKSVGEWFEANEEITSRMFSLPPTQSDGETESGDSPQESSGPSSTPSVKNPSG